MFNSWFNNRIYSIKGDNNKMEIDKKRKILHRFFIILFIILILILISIIVLGNTYMEWNKDSKLAVLGEGIHSFIWIFMRISPFLLIGSIVGICLTIKKD